jgi:hypothetical protein
VAHGGSDTGAADAATMMFVWHGYGTGRGLPDHLSWPEPFSGYVTSSLPSWSCGFDPRHPLDTNAQIRRVFAGLRKRPLGVVVPICAHRGRRPPSSAVLLVGAGLALEDQVAEPLRRLEAACRVSRARGCRGWPRPTVSEPLRHDLRAPPPPQQCRVRMSEPVEAPDREADRRTARRKAAETVNGSRQRRRRPVVAATSRAACQGYRSVASRKVRSCFGLQLRIASRRRRLAAGPTADRAARRRCA